jgi:chaperone required for assembly of F1-ATPase
VKRFWKKAAVVGEQDGWGIALDGKPVRTPAGKPLVVPTQALAQEMAGEWNRPGETIDPREMPLTGLANAAIDVVAPDPESFAAHIAGYGESDLVCYRAEYPRKLADRQAKGWDPLLDWARRRFEVDFASSCGIVHVPQPEPTVQRLACAVSALDQYRLAGLSKLVTIGGSLVAGLAVLEGAADPDEAWRAVAIDESWQLDQWGSDEEALAALEARRRDFLEAARFLKLLLP